MHIVTTAVMKVAIDRKRLTSGECECVQEAAAHALAPVLLLSVQGSIGKVRK